MQTSAGAEDTWGHDSLGRVRRLSESMFTPGSWVAQQLRWFATQKTIIFSMFSGDVWVKHVVFPNNHNGQLYSFNERTNPTLDV